MQRAACSSPSISKVRMLQTDRCSSSRADLGPNVRPIEARGACRYSPSSRESTSSAISDSSKKPPMVSGIVVSSDGKPVAGAVVATQLSHMHSSHSTSVSNSGTALFFSHAVATDAEGRFTLRELGPKDTPLQLHLNSDSLVLTEAITATPGDTAITLRAVQAGTASLTLAEPAYGELLTVYLERDGNRETSSYGRWRSGRFEWTGLVPGKYVLKATTTDQAVELLRDLEVSSNAACTDAETAELRDERPPANREGHGSRPRTGSPRRLPSDLCPPSSERRRRATRTGRAPKRTAPCAW
jgi:hypothetical protein